MGRSFSFTVPIVLVATSLGAAALAYPGPERPYRSPTREPYRGEVRWYEGDAPAANPKVDVDWRALADDVLIEMNLFRKDPRAYAQKLVALRQQMRGNLIERPGLPSIATQEGIPAVDEAISVLRRGPRRLPRLAPAAGLAAAAADHARDLGRTNGLGHSGSDGSGPEDRVARHGRWDVMVAENIAFGPTTGEEVIVGLLVDDGVPDRGHRKVLYERDLVFTGVACGPHPTYGATCVIDYAGAFESGKPTPRQADIDEDVEPDAGDYEDEYDDADDEDVADEPACPAPEVEAPRTRWRTIPGPR